jgi:hypothetical protein
MSQEKSIETVENGSAAPIQGQPLANIEAIEQVAMVSDKMINRKEKDEEKEVRDSASDSKTAAVVETHSSSIEIGAVAEQSDGASYQDVAGYNFVEGTSTEENGLVLGAVEGDGGLSSLSTLGIAALGVLATTLSSNTDEHRSDGSTTYVPPEEPEAPAGNTLPTEAAAMKLDYNPVARTFGGSQAVAESKADDDNVVQSMLKIVKPAGAEVWAGVAISEGHAEGSDLTADGSQAVTVKVYAEQAGELMLKLEQKNPDVFVELKEAVVQGWQTVSFDVSTAPDNIVTAALFPDLGVAGSGQTYLIDEVNFPAASIGDTTGLKLDYNPEARTFGGSQAVAESKADDDSVIQSLLKIVKPAGAEVWAGVAIAEGGPEGTDFTVDNSQAVTMKVYAEQAGELMLKLEQKNPDVFVELKEAVVQGWQTVSFDVSSAPDNVVTAAVFPDLGVAGSGQTYLIDEVTFPSSIFLA